MVLRNHMNWTAHKIRTYTHYPARYVGGKPFPKSRYYFLPRNYVLAPHELLIAGDISRNEKNIYSRQNSD